MAQKTHTTSTKNATPALAPRAEKGLLIVVEGVDGSGKSTQLELLQHWLSSNGFATVVTSWCSSETIRPLVKQIKRSETLVSPETFSLLHVADFSERYESVIRGALAAGKVVLCDRYVYTAYARDTSRGLALPWIKQLYSFAAAPDVALYFRVSPEVALSRKTKLPNFYEAGMDLGLSTNIKHSFDLFQRRVIAAYESLVCPEGLTVVDGETDIYVTFPHVKKIVADAIHAKFGVRL